MSVKKFNTAVTALSLVGLQACNTEDDSQSFGHIFVNQETHQAITAVEGVQETESVTVMANSEAPTQIWRTLQVGWDAYQLQNVATGACLTLSSDNIWDEAAQVELAPCEQSPAQYWLLSQIQGGGIVLSLTGSDTYLGVNPLCDTADSRKLQGNLEVQDEGGCGLVAVSASEAATFDMVEVEVDDDPGGDDSRQDDNDPGGDDSTPDDDPGGEDGTPGDNDPGGDDGTQDDDDPDGDDGSQDDIDTGGDDNTGDPGDQSDLA